MSSDLAVKLLGLECVLVVGSLHAGVERSDLLLARAQLRAQPGFHRSRLALLAAQLLKVRTQRTSL